MLRSFVLACALASLVTACSNDDGRDDDQLESDTDGTVTLAWTVGGSGDPAQCAAEGASQIEIDIYDQSGAQVGSYAEPCTSGSYVVSLNAGRFSATAHMLDANGQARTTVVDIEPFDIEDDTNFTIPVDFPISSFL